MSNKFLGQYLLEKGIISPKQLLDAIEYQKKSNPSLGQLAIEQGYLNESSANAINLEQQRTDERFGTLAIKMELMTEDQVEALFSTQQKTRKFFGEILVEKGIITEEVLQEELVHHKALKDTATLDVDTKIKEHNHATLITQTLETIVKSFTRIPKVPVQISAVEEHLPALSEDTFAISQLMHTPHTFKVGYVLPRSLMKTLGTSFLGFDVSEDEALYIDAVSELLNIILGNVLVINGAQQTELEPPVVQTVGDNIQTPYTKSFCIDMAANDSSFKVFFIFD